MRARGDNSNKTEVLEVTSVMVWYEVFHPFSVIMVFSENVCSLFQELYPLVGMPSNDICKSRRMTSKELMINVTAK